MSAHLSWMIIRNNNAFLVKRRNIKKPFSKEPNNLNNMHAFRYNGLIHKKSIGIVDSPDKKGFTVLYKKASARRHPARSVVRRTFKAGPRRALYKLRRLIRCNSYRGDLAKVALRKASAVLRSQRTIKAKKPRPTPAKAD